MKKIRISLRAKLIALVLTVIVLIGAGTFYNLGNLEKSFRSRIESQMEFDAVKLGKVLANELSQRYAEIQIFAINRSVATMNKEIMSVDFDRYTTIHDDYDLVVAVDKSGKLVASNSKDSAGRTVNFENLQRLDFSKMSWFSNTLAGKFTTDEKNKFTGTFVEDFVFDELTMAAYDSNRYGSSFSAQIKDAKGEVIGVISARANSKWIDDEVADFQKQMLNDGLLNSEVFLFNGAGKVAMHAEHRDGHDGVYIDKDPKIVLAKNADQVHSGLVTKLKANNTGFAYLPHEEKDTEYLVAFHKLANEKSIASLGWTIVFENSADDAFASAIKVRNQSYFFLFVNVFLGLLLAIWAGIVISKSISKVTQTLAMNSDEVSGASTKIASSATELSEAATEQAAALQETVAAVDQISAMVEKNAEAAKKSRDFSQSSRDAATKGQNTVAAMIKAIGEIDRSNDEVSQQMEDSNAQLFEITKLINDIRNKTTVINEIVFQTKLLSFNASVEAARAGEYGKGFAVVAEEVGNLAQMSGSAAKEISELLEVSVQKVNTIVNNSKSRVDKLMLVSKEKVNRGAQTAKECNDSLVEILNQVQTVDSLVSEIAVASQEQSTGIREVSKAMGQMEQATQQNSSVAQASSVAAEQLRGQSEILNSLVKDLAYIVSGSNTTPVIGEVQIKTTMSKMPVQKAIASARAQAKVLNFKTNKKVAPASGIKKVPVAAPVQEETKMAMASGSDFVPTANDPGFEE